MKQCTRCNETKDEREFYQFKSKKHSTRDGLYPHCRSCHLGYTSNWARLHPDKKREHMRNAYLRNPDKFRARSLNFHHAHRDIVINKGKRFAHLRWEKCIDGLGGECSCCGETYKTMLEIDHINGFGNAHRRKMGGSVGVYCDIIARNFPRDEFQVLCASCNQSRRRNVGECEHKTEKRIDKFDRFKHRFDQHLAETIGVA